jgi:uncharacterized membrane protein YhaH (DUF805 family)
MGFTEAITHVFQHYADFKGRARRSEYWYFALFCFLVSFGVKIVSGVLDNQNIYLGFAVVWTLATFLPGLGVLIRRLHDVGYSGWRWLVLFVPIIGGLIMLFWLVKDSQPGRNDYGDNPKESL